ncbi:restriction endonuclease subunit S [Variovorax boronicumulans]|uniref:restriction endonuclease subunit S n=1 Tax=Variovorax boronicumulans TaxID=436515 RepID=UPI001C55CA26
MTNAGIPGYRETDAGWIPKDWAPLSLGTIASARKSKAVAQHGVRCVELEHIKSETGRLLGWDSGGAQASIKTAFKQGDVLFGKLRPYLRKYAVAPFDGICTTEILAIHPKDDLADRSFLFQLMQGDGVFSTVEALSYGTKMPRVSWSDLADIVVGVPSLAEQRAVAAVLIAVDDKLDVIARQIEATETLKQGLMQTLFSRGIGTLGADGRWTAHAEFKDSPFGLIPTKWGVQTLGEVCDGALQTGPFGSQLHAHEYQDEGVPVLMPKDLVNCRANLETAAKVSQTRAEELDKHRLNRGDLLFSRRGDVARFALIDEKTQGALCGTGCLKAIPGKAHSPAYLAHLLQLDVVRTWLEQNAVGQTMPNMNTAILASLPLVVPDDRAEQERIADILDGVDAKANLLDEKQTNYQALKRGLMQKLLTGEWRVKVDAGMAA